MLGRMVEEGGDLPTMILWSAGWPQPPTNHYQPTGRELRAGDMFATELEARWAGYVGQRTQMGFIKGPVPPLYTQLADIQRMALERCYEMLRPGHTVGDLGRACARSHAGHALHVSDFDAWQGPRRRRADRDLRHARQSYVGLAD